MTFTAFVYEEDGVTAEDLITDNSQEEAIEFAKMNDWDEVVNDTTGEVVWKRQVKIRYYVCGLGYDENDEAIDYEVGFGDFDTLEEAYELFEELANRSDESFFVNASEVYEIEVRLEECEETEDLIECIDVKDEFGVTNPNYKEEY